MPTVPISMRKLKEILRLKYGVGLSHRQIGRSLAISPSVVSRYANRAAQLGIKQWPLGPSAIARLGIKRLDDSGHILPWQNLLHAGEENLFSGLTALSAEFTIGEGELMAHDVPLGCAPDEYDDLISGTCSHLP